jgi:hypothetical protein
MRKKATRTKVVGCTSMPLYRGGYRGGVTREAALVAQLPGILEQLRAAYRREVEALAGELQVQFEAGELCGPGATEAGFLTLLRACDLRFGLDRLSVAEVQLLVAASESSEETGTWAKPAHYAAEAIALDVRKVARARGWYSPTGTKEPSARRRAKASRGRAP